MGFEDNMIEDGFYDAQDYLEYICDKAERDSYNQNDYDEDYCENFDDED